MSNVNVVDFLDAVYQVSNFNVSPKLIISRRATEEGLDDMYISTLGYVTCVIKPTNKKGKLVLNASVSFPSDIYSPHEISSKNPERFIMQLIDVINDVDMTTKNDDMLQMYINVLITIVTKCSILDFATTITNRLARRDNLAQLIRNSGVIGSPVGADANIFAVDNNPISNEIEETSIGQSILDNMKAVEPQQVETETVEPEVSNTSSDDIINTAKKRETLSTTEVYDIVSSTIDTHPIVKLLKQIPGVSIPFNGDEPDLVDIADSLYHSSSDSEVVKKLPNVKTFAGLITVDFLTDHLFRSYNEAVITNYTVHKLTDLSKTLFDARLLNGEYLGESTPMYELILPHKWVSETRSEEFFKSLTKNHFDKLVDKGTHVNLDSQMSDALDNVVNGVESKTIRSKLEDKTLSDLIGSIVQEGYMYQYLSKDGVLQVNKALQTPDKQTVGVRTTLVSFTKTTINFIAYVVHINPEDGTWQIGKISHDSYKKQERLPDALMVLSGVLDINIG